MYAGTSKTGTYTMNPRKKVHSSRGTAFCWEDRPGVPKALYNNHHHHHNDCPNIIGPAEAVPHKSLSPISSPPPPTTNGSILDESSNMKIPPPPCGLHQPNTPRRSTFWKAFRRQRDPFLVAYNHCTKTPAIDNRIGVGFHSIAGGKTKVRFSCKSSMDARDDHFLKPPIAPRLPNASNPSFTTHT